VRTALSVCCIRSRSGMTLSRRSAHQVRRYEPDLPNGRVYIRAGQGGNVDGRSATHSQLPRTGLAFSRFEQKSERKTEGVFEGTLCIGALLRVTVCAEQNRI
jgi:hypothetical protein